MRGSCLCLLLFMRYGHHRHNRHHGHEVRTKPNLGCGTLFHNLHRLRKAMRGKPKLIFKKKYTVHRRDCCFVTQDIKFN